MQWPLVISPFSSSFSSFTLLARDAGAAREPASLTEKPATAASQALCMQHQIKLTRDFISRLERCFELSEMETRQIRQLDFALLSVSVFPPLSLVEVLHMLDQVRENVHGNFSLFKLRPCIGPQPFADGSCNQFDSAFSNLSNSGVRPAI